MASFPLPVDTTQLDKLVGKALAAEYDSRCALAAALYGRAADEASCLYGETFVFTYLTLQHSNQLIMQSQLEGVLKPRGHSRREDGPLR